MSQIPFFVSIPHSGERIPEQCTWLRSLPERILMSDVDRFVDRLYVPSLQDLNIPVVTTEWHRYAVDLNRIPSDIDASSVLGAATPAGKFTRGFHWVKTFENQTLMSEPMSADLHLELQKLIFDPFHEQVRARYNHFRGLNHARIFHIDAHSMPSVGTAEHRDPGEARADIVVSDCFGKSCARDFRDLVVAAYVQAGFKVRLNWPYFGGRVTETYGRPDLGQHAIQVELNRGLYMDEVTKQIKSDADKVQKMLRSAVEYVKSGLVDLGR